MGWQERIEVNPRILVGKPVIKGTRISVELVLDLLSSGATVDDVVRDYPHITRDDVLACVAFAAATIRSERTYPVSA
ncbi:MAG: DUF433 domain-containing protein [Planctomycetes bacterium]|jgi:uncharacterized protein (DUF433 family)|nr:DUF433 domain-containing protein [Planctomycetota bacterium]MCL4731386.1 DUF433 domain-containing protein [Planctomycetota bacterium]